MWSAEHQNDIDLNTLVIKRGTKEEVTWYPRSQCSVDLVKFASAPESDKNWGNFFNLSKSDPRLGMQRVYFVARVASEKINAENNYFVQASASCRMRTYCYFVFSGCTVLNAGIECV
jgi:hypothetical protein